MQKKGLLFIPDISGFTQFIHDTELEHSRLIIQELLEVLINANEMGLQISEIEGDAILFYKLGEPPALTEMYGQVEKMFCAFHKNLMAYDLHKYCQCKACTSAIELTLKIITHYGEFTEYQVKNFLKLIGKDVIVAHQLLKNDIQPHEYWLITDEVQKVENLNALQAPIAWKENHIQTSAGRVNYHFAHLSELKSKVSADQFPRPNLDEKVKVISQTAEYDAGLITLFHAAGNFTYRHQWWPGVTKVEELNHFLPRVGMKCKYTLDNGESYVYSNSYNFENDRIEFSETQEGSDCITFFTLELVAPRRTRLTIDYYIRKNWLNTLMFSLKEKRKVEETIAASMSKLPKVISGVKLPEHLP